MDTLRPFKRCGAKGVYRQMSCRGITRPSAVLYRLLTQTIERDTQEKNCQEWQTHKKKKWKRTKVCSRYSPLLVVISMRSDSLHISIHIKTCLFRLTGGFGCHLVRLVLYARLIRQKYTSSYFTDTRDGRFGSKVGQIGPLWSQTYHPCRLQTRTTHINMYI